MLTQVEANALIAMQKRLDSPDRIDFPQPGEKASWSATSLDDRERFRFDVNRGRIRLLKCTYQERYRATEILVRVDVDGPPHTNPDGVMIPCPHIHVYREGYADKWAEPLPNDVFSTPNDLAATLRSFLRYCNVQDIPEIQESLL